MTYVLQKVPIDAASEPQLRPTKGMKKNKKTKPFARRVQTRPMVPRCASKIASSVSRDVTETWAELMSFTETPLGYSPDTEACKDLKTFDYYIRRSGAGC
ncbi:unnamed protein product [Fusarium graminearum]|nr:unnamed protein product [Fusarium graminearum]